MNLNNCTCLIKLNRFSEFTQILAFSAIHHYNINRSNMRHRPIGIGVQGFADVFMMLKTPFDSDRAKKLNKDIFETIYFGACSASCELAAQDGSYETFEGSPVSQGLLQFDMWNVKPSDRWDWDELKSKISQNGMRNSLLVAPMPTASTAQILGNNESTEPYTSNMYNRRVLAGEFTVVNKHLLRELTSLGLWTPSVRNHLLQIMDPYRILQRFQNTFVKYTYFCVFGFEEES